MFESDSRRKTEPRFELNEPSVVELSIHSTMITIMTVPLSIICIFVQLRVLNGLYKHLNECERADFGLSQSKFKVVKMLGLFSYYSRIFSLQSTTALLT